jgi:glutamate-1-semialdehyde 2,1-aminomutase
MIDRLTAHERAAIELLCGGGGPMRAVIEEVARRQPGSIAWNERAAARASGLPSLAAFAGPLLPLCVERAAGARIVDVDGREFVDCHMAYTASVLGHAPPPVTRAVRRALDRGLGGGHFFAEQIELAELVAEMVSGVERVAFFHSGGEAVAAAVRLARAATGRLRVAKFEGCYHGSHELGLHNTMPILAGPLPAGDPEVIEPRPATAGVRTASAQELMVLPFNTDAALERIREAAGGLACVLVDPVPPFLASWPEVCRGFVRRLCRLCGELDVPVVFDEVVCGFRLAPGGAREWSGATPSMSCFAKITSGLGIPLSMVAGEARFLDRLRSDGPLRDQRAGKACLASTLGANFLAVVGALAQLRHLRERFGEIAARLDRNHARLSARLAELAAAEGIGVSLAGHPRLQMQLALGLREPEEKTYRGVMRQASLARLLSALAMTLYLRLEGVYVKSSPSLNLSAAHGDRETDQVAGAIERCLRRMNSDGALAA